MKKNIVLFLMLFYHSSVLSQQEVVIENVEIIGNKITKKEIILREILFAEKDSFSIKELDEKIDQSKKNLINLRLFNFVEIQKTKVLQKISITITVVERWYFWPYPILEISERNFNTWWEEFTTNNYSDFSRLNYGLFFNWENFRGRNELIRLKLRKGFKEHYLISYKIPYLNKQKSIGIEAYAQLFRRKKTFYKTYNDTLVYYTNEQKYTAKDYEFCSEILYRKGVHKTHKIRFQYSLSDIDSNITINNPHYLYNNSNIGTYSKLTYEFSNEHRDYIIYPLTGYYLYIEANKYFHGTSPVNHFEIIGQAEKHIELTKLLFIGSSFKSKLSSNGYQPYFMQKGFGFDDYVRGYEYYIVDGQDYWLSKTAFKFAVIEKTNFEIPYINVKQFNKSHYSLYVGLFSDLGYVIDNQNSKDNSLSNCLLWGNGISFDCVTYYDKLIRIEFSINHLGEKGVFLHFSNPFGSKKKL